MLGRAATTNVPNVDVTSVLASASPGPHAISITQIASASALVGVPIPPPPDGSTINMTIRTPDGTFTVTFNAGATFAQTAANLTQAMTNAGLSIEAATDGASFSLAEKRPGSRHTFEITAGASDLGLTQPLVRGNDARVSFAGTSVTGDGSSVINDGVALRVRVTAGELATAGGSVDGTYTVNVGLAATLARIGGNSTTGTAKTARDGIDSQIKTLNERISRYDDSLKMKQDQLTAKFTAMDTVLTRLQAQMTSLVNFTTSLG
jgi:flagellar hook-associated protein 2